MKQPASRAKPVDRMILHVLNHRRSTRRLGRGAAVMVLAMASAGNVIAGSSDLRYGWTNVVSAPDGISGSAATDIDSSGNILVFGVFDEAADMDPGEGEDIHVCEDRCMFLSKYGPDGTYRWTVS